MPTPPQPQRQPGVVGLLKEKKAGAPVAVWAGVVVLVLVLGAMYFQHRRSSSSATSSSVGGANGSDNQGVPNLNDSAIFVVPPNPSPAINITMPTPTGSGALPPGNTTVPAAPPGGGRPNPPAAPPPVPSAIPKPTPPQGIMVPFVTYTSNNPPWNSTVWGVWNHYKTAEGIPAPNWETVWNDPVNAPLRAKRGAPNRVQKGDQIFVRGAH